MCCNDATVWLTLQTWCSISGENRQLPQHPHAAADIPCVSSHWQLSPCPTTCQGYPPWFVHHHMHGSTTAPGLLQAGSIRQHHPGALWYHIIRCWGTSFLWPTPKMCPIFSCPELYGRCPVPSHLVTIYYGVPSWNHQKRGRWTPPDPSSTNLPIKGPETHQWYGQHGPSHRAPLYYRRMSGRHFQTDIIFQDIRFQLTVKVVCCSTNELLRHRFGRHRSRIWPGKW